MRRQLLIGVISLILIHGCSSFNFLGFEEDTGLYVIDKPKKYNSEAFGLEIAATSSLERDLIAVSAGEGFETIFYETSAEGRLKDIEDPWKVYPPEYVDVADSVSVLKQGSGVSLVGIPYWTDNHSVREEQLYGCVAIGEPSGLEDGSRVVFDCEPGNTTVSLMPPDGMKERFGHQIAAIRPSNNGAWLLAVASTNDVAVFSGFRSEDHSQIVRPEGELSGEIYELAAGRVIPAPGEESLFFLAVATFNNYAKRYQVYLFLQSVPGSKEINQVACFERPQSVGYGGVLATGDLDRDGSDELVVSAARVRDRAEIVDIYRITDMLPDPSNPNASHLCLSDANQTPKEPFVSITPVDGDPDVKCEEDCGFGTALVIGDIATDDDGPELIIGAKRARVDGTKKAGAVYIFRDWSEESLKDGQPELVGQVYDSMPEKEDEFGGGLAVAKTAGRNELIVGSTGAGQVTIAFCTGVGKDLSAGGDLPEDATGTIVSTRCRP